MAVEDQVIEEAVYVAKQVPFNAAVGVAALVGIGAFAAGYFLAENRLRTKYSEIAESEIEEMRELFQARMIAREVKPDLSDLTQVVEEEGYATPVVAPIPEPETPDIVVEGPEEENVFDRHGDFKWDYKEELAKRQPDVPYVIHVDELGETGYTRSTLTYYIADDVLADDQDTILGDADEVICLSNVARVGHGSDDPQCVYIRNDRLGVDITLSVSEDSYGHAIHGLEHSDEDGAFRRRVRFDDEPSP